MKQNSTSRKRSDSADRNHNHGSSSSQTMKKKSSTASSTCQSAGASNYQNDKRQKMDHRGGGKISSRSRTGTTEVSTKPLSMVKVEKLENNLGNKFSEQNFDRETKKTMLLEPQVSIENYGVHKSDVSDISVTKIAATSPKKSASMMVAVPVTKCTTQMPATLVKKIAPDNISVPTLSHSGKNLNGFSQNNQAQFICGFEHPRKPFQDSVPEEGQSSYSKNNSKFVDDSNKPCFVCGICIEQKFVNETFSIKGCTHTYCTDCVNKYIESKVQENVANILCPSSNCQGILEPEYCQSILPRKVFDNWCDALCEAAIIGCQKFYCPFKDCSGMLIDDGTQQIRESECPHCRRLFCAQCMAPWHSEIDCKEFQKLHKDEREREDILLMKLAESKLWKRCPNCRMYVERTHGCKYMRCRCGTYFCYGCGTTAIDLTSHYCRTCQA